MFHFPTDAAQFLSKLILIGPDHSYIQGKQCRGLKCEVQSGFLSFFSSLLRALFDLRDFLWTGYCLNKMKTVFYSHNLKNVDSGEQTYVNCVCLIFHNR